MTALMVKIGGRQGGKSHGIHWHVDPNHTLRYLSDRSREKIYEIELTDKTEGSKKVFKLDEAAPKGLEWRTMDCVDCHNRPSHNFRTPEFEVDLAITEGRIDRSLPFIKREGVRILTEKEYPSHEAARDGISAAVEQFYATNYPALANSACRRTGGQGARRRVHLEQLPAHEGGVEHVPESHRAPAVAGLLPLPRQQAQDGHGREGLQEVRHLPQRHRRGRSRTRGCCRSSVCRRRPPSRPLRQAAPAATDTSAASSTPAASTTS